MDGLDHLSGVIRGEGGAQGLVAPDDLGERPLEYAPVGAAGEPEHQVEVVERAAGLELVEEPEPLLVERCRRQRRWGPERVAGRSGAAHGVAPRPGPRARRAAGE